jgi:hypothetical protein
MNASFPVHQMVRVFSLCLAFSPAGFHHAGYLSFKCQLSEADAAHSKIPHETPGPSTSMTSVVLAYPEFGFSFGFLYQTRLGQMRSLNSFVSLPGREDEIPRRS